MFLLDSNDPLIIHTVSSILQQKEIIHTLDKNKKYFFKIDIIKNTKDIEYHRIFIKNIPIYTKVKEKDLFITSGAEGIFPRGIKVGRVEKVSKDLEKQILLIKLKLEEDFSKLNVGFIVKNSTKTELNHHLEDK